MTYSFRHLKSGKMRTFQAVAARILPEAHGMAGGDQLLTAAVVDWVLEKADDSLRKKLLLFLQIIRWGPMLFYGRPFHRLDGQRQDRFLRRMEQSPVRLFRMGFFGLQTYIKMGYYTRETEWGQFGYPGPVYPDQPYPDPVIRAISQGTIRFSKHTPV